MKKTKRLRDHSPMSERWRHNALSGPARGLNMLRASDVKPKKLPRVWEGRFYRGKLGFIAGEPGLGKSLIAIHMAATVSTGGAWPCGKGSARLGDVIYITAEDRAAYDSAAA